MPHSPAHTARLLPGEISRGGNPERSDTVMAALLRFLAGVMLLVAVVFAVNDGTHSLLANRPMAVTVQENWSALSPASLKNAQSTVERHLHPAVWSWAVLRLLQLPTWTLFAAVGLIFAYLGRRRRRVNVYAN